VSVYSQLQSQEKTYRNLQEAIWDAPSGDMLQVGAMTLTGPGNRDLGLGDRPLTIRGDGALRTIVDCAGVGQGFVIDGSYSAAASITISGISIRNCYADTAIRGGNGGGIYAKSASLTLTSINVEGCKAEVMQSTSIHYHDPSTVKEIGCSQLRVFAVLLFDVAAKRRGNTPGPCDICVLQRHGHFK
jgi:hypothetical protein